MLALIAGTGDLPRAVLGGRTDVLVCAMEGFVPDLPVDVVFGIETLGSFLADLSERGVTEVCFAGVIRRPVIDPAKVDIATVPLITAILDAIKKGDDGALRTFIKIFEDHGIAVIGADQLARHLLPVAGVPTKTRPLGPVMQAAVIGEKVIARLGSLDQGQACIIGPSDVIAEEGPEGTDAMLTDVGRAEGAILYKAPKPNQDRRADLPVIGIETARKAVQAGLTGIVIEAGGVMVLDMDAVCEVLNANYMTLWVRPRTET